MKAFQRQIIKVARCDVLDFSCKTMDETRIDLQRRLRKQERQLDRCIDNHWDTEIVGESILRIRRSLQAITDLSD